MFESRHNARNGFEVTQKGLDGISTIIFDAGGVLIYIQEYRQAILSRVLRSSGYPDEMVEMVLSRVSVFDREYFQYHELVDWNDEKKWLVARCEHIAEAVGGDALLADKLFMLSFDTFQYQLYDDTVASLEQLKPHYSLSILSNATASLDWSFDQLGLRPYFEHIVISAYEQSEKPEASIYLKTLARLNKTPQECIFIDDRIENVEAARKLGMLGYHIDRTKGATLQDFVAMLLSA